MSSFTDAVAARMRRAIRDAFTDATTEAFAASTDSSHGEVTGHPVRAVIERYLSRPASYVRPLLLEATARAYGVRGAESPGRALVALAAATELLHIFALIHDDVIDRDRPVRASGMEESTTSALLAGDLVHSIAAGLLAHTVVDRDLDRTILGEVRAISVRTILGQYRDMHYLPLTPDHPIGFDDLYRLYDEKTGWYTVAAPLRIGAFAAGSSPDATIPASPEELALLTRVALPLGRAYQLRDDCTDLLAALRSPEERRPFPRWELNLAVTWLHATGHPVPDSVPSTTGSPADMIARLREVIDPTSLSRDIEERITALRTEAERAARALSLPARRREDLLRRAREILDL